MTSGRTQMLARGLEAQRRMAYGPAATVYVLGRGDDGALEVLGTTTAATIAVLFGGALELRITETDDLDRVALMRAIGVGMATGADSGHYLFNFAGPATQAIGQAARLWTIPVKPNGVPWTPPDPDEHGPSLLLKSGGHLALKSGGRVLLKGAA